MAISLPFQPGAYGVRGEYNFVNSLNVHRPEYDEELTYRYGNQGLYGFLTMIGAEKAVSSLKYSHFEEDRSYPKIKATTAGAGAGAAATFTVDAAATDSISQQDPYLGSTTKDIIVPRVNDTIMVKPASGTTSAGDYIKCIVTSVNKSAGTFVASPIISGESVPAIAAAQEIVIYGSAHGEGSGQPESMNSTVSEFSNTLQLIKENYKITGTEKDQIMWFKAKGANGKSGYFWKLKGEKDTYDRFMTKKELTMLLGEQLTNATLADVFAANDEPVTLTEGLIPFMLGSNGNQINYSKTSGFDKENMNTLVKTLNKQKGSKVNMLVAGMDLSIQMDETLADHNVAGAISYGSFSMDQDAARNFQFGSFAIGGYRFDKKVFDAFNDLQTLGAEGFGFSQEAMVIPMDKKMDKGSNEMTQSLRTRYLVGDNGERYDDVAVVDKFRTGDNGEDAFEVRYKSACGFEGFAANRFAYIK